jgi:hypothetical protein
MKKKQITFMLIALSFLLVLGFSGQALAGETYKIASSLAITGPTSDVGSPYAKGIEDYCKYVNDEKLLGDDKLECIVRDDGYKTEVTKRNFEEFLDEDIVFYLNYSTGSTMAMKKISTKKRFRCCPHPFMPATWSIQPTFFFRSPPIPARPSGWPNMWPTTTKAVASPKWLCFCIRQLSVVHPATMFKKRSMPVWALIWSK